MIPKQKEKKEKRKKTTKKKVKMDTCSKSTRLQWLQNLSSLDCSLSTILSERASRFVQMMYSGFPEQEGAFGMFTRDHFSLEDVVVKHSPISGPNTKPSKRAQDVIQAQATLARHIRLVYLYDSPLFVISLDLVADTTRFLELMNLISCGKFLSSEPVWKGEQNEFEASWFSAIPEFPVGSFLASAVEVSLFHSWKSQAKGVKNSRGRPRQKSVEQTHIERVAHVKSVIESLYTCWRGLTLEKKRVLLCNHHSVREIVLRSHSQGLVDSQLGLESDEQIGAIFPTQDAIYDIFSFDMESAKSINIHTIVGFIHDVQNTTAMEVANILLEGERETYFYINLNK